MWQRLKKYKRLIYSILFVAVLLRALLNPYSINHFVQSSFDKIFLGKFHFNSIAIDFSGEVHIRNFQIVEGKEILLNADNVDIDIDFWPIFTGEFVVKSVDIKHLEFRWLVDNKGEDLWLKALSIQKKDPKEKRSTNRLTLDAVVNVEQIHALYQIPEFKRHRDTEKREMIGKNAYIVEKGRIVDSQLNLKDKVFTARVPVHMPNTQPINMVFKNSKNKFAFEVLSPELYWNKRLSRSLSPDISQAINFLNPQGAFSHEMTYVYDRTKRKQMWTMSSKPIIPKENDPAREVKRPNITPLGFDLPLFIEKGDNNSGELAFEPNGQLILNGIDFYYQNFAGQKLIEGEYFFTNNVSHAYIKKIDVTQKEVIDGLPPGVAKVIRQLKPNKPLSIDVHYDHRHAHHSKIVIRFKDINFHGLKPSLHNVTGEIIFENVDFKKNIYKGRAKLSKFEVLHILFDPQNGNTTFPLIISGDDIKVGTKEEPIQALGQWAYATGYVHIDKEKTIADIDIKGFDLERFQQHNKFALNTVKLLGFVHGNININTKEFKDRIGNIKAKLVIDDKNGIDCRESFPVSSFIGKTIDPTKWPKLFGSDSRQYITSADFDIKVLKTKMEVTGTLKGTPFNMGVSGSVNYIREGRLDIKPSLTFIDQILLSNLIAQKLEWNRKQISFGDKVVWKEKAEDVKNDSETNN